MGRLDGRRAIVTGASRGIGAGLAERLSAEGAAVVITARTVDQHDHLAGSLNETLARCRRHGGTVESVAADLADPTDRARIVPEAVAALGGPIDVLVNNAAAGIHMPMAEFPHRRRRIMFEVNLEAPLDLAQAVLPPMLERGEGWIVNITSGSSRLLPGPPYVPTAMPGAGIYGTTKAALNRATNAMAAELWGTGVRLNALDPAKPVASEGAIEHLQDRLPPDAFVPVEIIAEATVFLCTCGPEITGHVYSDQPLLDEHGVTVMTLDGARPFARS
jgi:NAD(P)-dependent dehydrogenase (short-subunit alcohol dehydrogenase family)